MGIFYVRLADFSTAPSAPLEMTEASVLSCESTRASLGMACGECGDEE